MRYIPQLWFIIVLHLFFTSCNSKQENKTWNGGPSQTTPSTKVVQNEASTLIKKGEPLFKTNCIRCHEIHKTDNYLQGIVERLGKNYLKIYLTKQDSLIKVKDKYALAIKRTYGNLGNSHNFDFSDEQVKAIIAYLKKHSG